MQTSLNPTPLILTIDLGTTSTRAMLFDATARPVPGRVSQVSNRLRTTSDGGAEFDAAHLLDNVVAAIDQLLDGLDDAHTQIAAIAMDTFVGNLLGVDESGQPVTPVYTYADTRNARDAQALRAELGETGLAQSHDRTGCMLHTSYLPARFRWLQRTRPDLDEQVAGWISIGEYVQARLTEIIVGQYECGRMERAAQSPGAGMGPGLAGAFERRCRAVFSTGRFF